MTNLIGALTTADMADDDPSPHRWRRPYPVKFLYVIVLSSERIKVGVTVSPEQRLKEHRSLARAFGTESGRQWVSGPGIGTPENEAALVGFCAERATGQFRREYFSGLTFETVVAYAEILNGRRGTVRRNPDLRGSAQQRAH